ncbi:hypothetical protein EVAR_79728_1 [Eumeta japonica]|uniref:Uncharacterized protein n=1 Tax=Eumeta variegata TaxID=151549 RepID=A0A4C1T9D7_EUMVA|nr:hypothetical protein EVAR_79728_1 [Eumeta japonica]
MVNGNYRVYGETTPAAEAENRDNDARTVERKYKRKQNRSANELYKTLNMRQIDNETDSIKYERRAKEPRLLRYVSSDAVREHYVTDHLECYDEPARRHTFTKKAKNPIDGANHYTHSRSSSNCSSPTGNLPTISEHGEQYGTFRVQAPCSVTDDVEFERKLDKYFGKPRDDKYSTKVGYHNAGKTEKGENLRVQGQGYMVDALPDALTLPNQTLSIFAERLKCVWSGIIMGTHPDSLCRVPMDSGSGSQTRRALRLLRWPACLVVFCIALALFVYFVMPESPSKAQLPRHYIGQCGFRKIGLTRPGTAGTFYKHVYIRAFIKASVCALLGKTYQISDKNKQTHFLPLGEELVKSCSKCKMHKE